MKNEESSLLLYEIVEKYKQRLSTENYHGDAFAANLLGGTCFALWRAVFLSDCDTGDEAHVGHLFSFIGNLIANNTVGYVQDRSDRNFTFVFYVQTARHRLLNVAMYKPHKDLIDDLTGVERVFFNDWGNKAIWSFLQTTLTTAIRRFGAYLDEHNT